VTSTGFLVNVGWSSVNRIANWMGQVRQVCFTRIAHAGGTMRGFAWCPGLDRKWAGPQGNGAAPQGTAGLSAPLETTGCGWVDERRSIPPQSIPPNLYDDRKGCDTRQGRIDLSWLEIDWRIRRKWVEKVGDAVAMLTSSGSFDSTTHGEAVLHSAQDDTFLFVQ
jgi:hypothetical protein